MNIQEGQLYKNSYNKIFKVNRIYSNKDSIKMIEFELINFDLQDISDKKRYWTFEEFNSKIQSEELLIVTEEIF